MAGLELTPRWWLVPGQEHTSQRIDVMKYPDWPELAAVPVVETWTPFWRKYETLNLSGDVVVSETEGGGSAGIRRTRGPHTVSAFSELTSIWGTRR